jgi:energy-coupling factor transporter ATP-binding protein EcfA2
VLKQEIHFSPYFTCIIGGRGAGKSTIINIIAETLGEKTAFFKENKIVVEGKGDVLKDYTKDFITINGTNEIEFISQGKVEELSQGSHLTDLIFNERIKAVGNEYEIKEQELINRFKIIDDNIAIIKELARLRTELSAKEASLENDKKIIASIQNETYKKLSSQINEVTTKLNELTYSKQSYQLFLNDIKELFQKYPSLELKDEYSLRVVAIKAHIELLDEIKSGNGSYEVELKVFAETDKLIEKYSKQLGELKQQVVDYFTSIGTTEDSIADVDRATSNIAVLENSIKALNNQIHIQQEQFDKNIEAVSDIEKLSSECNEIIKSKLQKINIDLNIDNENVEKIRFDFSFDTKKYEHRLFSDFYEQFKLYHKTNLSWENIYWCLRLISPDKNFLNLNYKDFIEQIEQKSFDRNLLYSKVFYDIFSAECNFDTYKLLIKKHLFDVSNTIEIIGYYGSNPLASCSFGQRCTAVVVTLLMTGMKPLLIDEPEAHLDNKLIAEYLVDLLKEKKNERQIIFATHNANFVVNGDAELIHILEIPKGKVYTEIISTTIENLSHRNSLLKLEGGEEAFRKRDRKLLASYS